mmetsp:Transcript_58038/g.160452  ORF Transcript_58038/g.160452 Transcript_58038/m.160452 type:complete len:363 (+) Transcript_58038:246-1334(+)
MAFSWSMTTLATASVCLTCAYRLIDYRRRGVLRFGEIKTAFHISLLVYGALGLPYDMFCLVNYDVWQCDVVPGMFGYDIVFQSWTVYSLDRLVAPLLTVALSLTVLSWSDFVRHGETRLVISELMHQGSRGDDDRAAVLAFRLRAALFVINAICILVAAAVAVPILLEPSRAESAQSQFSGLVYVNWIMDNVVSAVITFLMLYYGIRLQKRIRKSSAFDQVDRDGILRQIVCILTFMTICQVVRLVGVSILLYPFFDPDMSLGVMTFRFYQEHQILFTFTTVLPKELLAMSLLYLMRVPPRKPFVSYAIDSADYGENAPRVGYSPLDDDQHAPRESSLGDGAEGTLVQAETGSVNAPLREST